MDTNRVAMKQRFRKAHFIPTEIRDSRTNRCVTDGNPDHEGQSQAAVNQSLTELGILAILCIDVQRGRVMRERTEPHIVCFGDRATNLVVKRLANREFFEIQSGHIVACLDRSCRPGTHDNPSVVAIEPAKRDSAVSLTEFVWRRPALRCYAPRTHADHMFTEATDMRISRRDFTKAGLSASVLAATGASHAQEPLIKRAIPSSGEEVPIVGVGTNRYGVGDDEAARAPLLESLRRFHELGGTMIDTAPMYRSSEQVLGELIDELLIADDLFMATKVDVEGTDAINARMERSFRRLKYDTMDLMQCHNLIGWRDAVARMKDWKAEGRVRYVGITTSRANQYGDFERVMRDHDLDFIQINYSLADQRTSADRILPLAADRGMAVLLNRTFGGGGVFSKLSQVELPPWTAEFDCSSWGQFLLKYALSHPAVTMAAVGMTKVRHVEDNLAAATGRMPTAEHRRQMEAFFDGL